MTPEQASFLPRLNKVDWHVIAAVALSPGTTMPAVAAIARENGVIPASKTYGLQRPISSSIAKLRKIGILTDVVHRCDHCGSALTRGTRNVPLTLTPYGLDVVHG